MAVSLRFFLLFSLLLMLQAEPPGAAVTGTVRDPQGAVIRGAVVQVVDARSGVERKAESNEVGLFRVPVAAGMYRLNVTANGFSERQSEEFTVNVGVDVRIDMQLALAGAQSNVEVLSVGSPLQTESPTDATLVTERPIQDLPLNGRQLQNLALTAPGVAAGWNWSTAANRYGKARENTEGAFSVNGVRSRSNAFVLDGVPFVVRQYSVINFEPSNEAVQEFALQSGPLSAEYGRTMGATVNIVTRSGSRDFHGSLYEFFRNDVLDANNTFNKRSGLPRGKVRQNQFGGSLGGKIFSDKHFFFVNTELLRNIEASETRLTSVPTADERRGIIQYRDRNGQLVTTNLAGQITPLSARLVALYPQPNAVAPNGLNYNAPLTIALNDYQWHARTDHYLTARDTGNVRVSWGLNDQEYVINRFGGPYIPGFSLPNPERTTNAALGWLRTWSPTVTQETRLGFNRYANDLANGDPTNPASIGLPNGSSANGIPNISFTAGALEQLGGQPWFNREQNETSYFGSQSVSWLRGKHTYKFGGEVSRYHYNTRGAGNQRGSLVFDGSQNTLIPRGDANLRASALVDLLLGLPQQASIVVGDFGRGYRQWAWALFAQDTWRATRKLTLTYGLRYEYAAPWNEVNDKLSNYVPGRGLLTANDAGWEGLYRPDRNNFAPRLGLAYDVKGDGKTIVRAGYGILYETLLQASTVQPVENNAPFSAAAITFAPTPFARTDAASTTLLDLRRSATPSRSLAAVPLDLRSPYTQQWSLDVQQAFGSGWVGQLGYRGSRGVHLPLNYDINQVPLELGGRVRPIAGFNNITLYNNAANSIYHALQARVERRFKAGWHVLGAYTWGKSIDNASDFDSGDASERVLNSYDLRRQRGVSSFDITQRLTTSFGYQVPFRNVLARGWQVNGILTVQTGQPFTPFTSVFDPVRGENYNRLRVVGDPNANVPAGFAYNPAAFASPLPGTFGNSGRNIVRGDGFRSFDFSVFRNIAITERWKLQIRGEAINSFNAVNYQGPAVNQAGSPGQFVAAAPPRQIQLGAKLSF